MEFCLKPEEIRAAAESDLLVFIKLLAPHLLMGQCHVDLINWWQSSARKRSCIVLLPRGHLKSKLVAYKTAWELTRDPTSTILYVSATAALAEKQLGLIKRVLTSRTYMKYWPEMVNPEEAKREKWTATEIGVDHPQRAKEGIRDPSIKACGLTTNITGFHATNVKLDDVVVPNNAYTEDGRTKVANLISQISSIKEPESITDCVGTRYHGKDQYDTFLKQCYKTYDEETGEVVGEEYVWDSYIKVVEQDGVFLWPRQRREDGKSFGFNANILSQLRAEYEDKTQFYAQYYNNPNDPSTVRVGSEKFQYYDRKFLKNVNDRWTFNGQPLNVYAAIDFAFSMNKKADFTALVVIGVDPKNNYYILDIDRFKSDRISDYFEAILRTYRSWGYRKIRCEVTVAQQVIVRDLKENYIRPQGLNLVVDEFRPNRHEGTKEERVSATLEPKYDNLQMWHYKGGYIADLEEELLLARPAHDDIKDALTAAIDIAVAPRGARHAEMKSSNIIYNSRFGGVAFNR